MFTDLVKAAKAPKVPAKYLEGLTGQEREKRKKELQRRMKSGGSFEPLPSDKGAKTKPSKYSRTKLAAETRKRMKGNSKKEFLDVVSDLTGIKRSILNEVHERGAKAWTIGHRVGASQVAWSRARVYSFATGGKTQKTADKDLWKKHKDS